jgi:hypothetical protein
VKVLINFFEKEPHTSKNNTSNSTQLVTQKDSKSKQKELRYDKTKKQHKMTLTLALSYGSREN